MNEESSRKTPEEGSSVTLADSPDRTKDGEAPAAGMEMSSTHNERMSLLGNLDIQLTIEVGRAFIRMRDLLDLKRGSVVELDKSSGDPVEIYANQKKIASGNIVTSNGKYCVKISSILDEDNE